MWRARKVTPLQHSRKVYHPYRTHYAFQDVVIPIQKEITNRLKNTLVSVDIDVPKRAPGVVVRRKAEGGKEAPV